MLVISPQYEGFYGAVGRVGRGAIETLFIHLLGFPIWPRGTYWVEGRGDGRTIQPLRRDLRSIAAGYLRGWALGAAIWLLVVGTVFAVLPGQQIAPGDPMPFGRSIAAPIGLALGTAATLATIVIWIATRFPVRGDALAQRAVTQSLLGTRADPAMLEKPWSERDDLKRAMASLAEQLGGGSGLFDHWRELAVRDDVRSVEYLRMALTTARLCEAAPETGRDAAEYRALHDAIWARLVALDPSVRVARPG